MFAICAMILVGFNEISFSIEERTPPITVFNTKLGTAPGEFGYRDFEDNSWIEPTAIAIDVKGSIYIADPLNKRVQKYDKNGHYVSKIDLLTGFFETTIAISDLTTDKLDNLYVLSMAARKIIIYDASGKLINSILLDGRDIAWSEYSGWQSAHHLVTVRIAVDVNGYIYMESQNSLIKFDQAGKVVKKWPHYSTAPSFFLDQNGNIYYSNFIEKQGSKKTATWDIYDKNGNYLREMDNANNPYPAVCPPQEISCKFPPMFVDSKGNYYYCNLDGKTGDLKTIYKFNKDHKLINRYSILSPNIWTETNMVKFDDYGNLYDYVLNPSKHEFTLLRFNLN